MVLLYIILENYEELSDNLMIDLDDPLKKNNKISSEIENLGQKTLNDTMTLLNDFLHDKTY